MATLDDAMAEATKNGRVCPQPNKWDELYHLLPQQRQKGRGWEQPLPLILAAWHNTPNIFKALRLREHLEWAARYNAIDNVYTFLLTLKESEWHHYND